MTIEAVSLCWLELARREGFPPVQSKDVWSLLCQSYGEGHRRYHTLDHVASMLEVLKWGKLRFRDRSVVELAVLFHDVVYDARRDDNETQSAELATSVLSGCGFSAERTARVSEFILATASHPPETGDDDLDTFLDADLAILGEPRDRYLQYVSDVRAEFSFVSDDQWRIGRTKVLNHFLAAPAVYRTTWFRESREELAVRNLRGELRDLDVTR